MNLKLVGGFVLAVVLSFVAGFGVSTWGQHIEKKTQDKFEGSISTIIQNSLDTQFGQINKEYKDGFQQAADKYFADKKSSDAANALLNSNGNGWVWVQPTDQKPAGATKATAGSERPKPASPVRAELSASTSVPLKSDARRADQCAIDYNKLKSDYDRLWLVVYNYNKTVDTYNSQFTK